MLTLTSTGSGMIVLNFQHGYVPYTFHENCGSPNNLAKLYVHFSIPKQKFV